MMDEMILVFDRDRKEALNMAIEALRNSTTQMSGTSVQPEPLTEAEVIICKMYLDDLDKYKTCNEYKLLMRLLDGTASAQSEIVRCKDCKNSEHWYWDRRRCFLWAEEGISVFDDGFCNYAKRRTDD